MSPDLSAEIAAYATVALAVLALATAILAGLAFRKQSREVSILAEQNKRDIDDRHRDQASRVFIRAEAQAGRDQDQVITGLIVHIWNTSEQPVYDGFTGHREGDQWIDDRERKPDLPSFAILMPGEDFEFGIGFANPVPVPQFWKDNSGLLTSLRFRDAAGVHWSRYSDGRLDEEPAQFFTRVKDPMTAP